AVLECHLAMLGGFALRDLHARVVPAAGGVLVLEWHRPKVRSRAARPLGRASDRQPEGGAARGAHDPHGADLTLDQPRLLDRPEGHVDGPPALGLELSRDDSARAAYSPLQLP